MSKSKFFLKYFILSLAVLFFIYEFFLRVLPATTSKSIMSSLSMTIEEFAFIGSGYYLTYSIMQIPVGMLLDRFPIRFLITIASAFCCVGVLWFSVAETTQIAFVCRLLIGFGSSFGFVGFMVVVLNWFPKKYFAFIVGCGQFLGALGPLCAGAPIAVALKALNGDWRKLFFIVAIFGLVLTLLIALFLKGKPTNTDNIIFIDRKRKLSTRIKKVLSSGQVWAILSYAAGVYVSLPLLGAFWGTAYLESKGLPKASAALVISMIWVGLAVGSTVFGKTSDSIKRRKPLLLVSPVLGLLGSLSFLFLPIDNIYLLASCFFLVGLGGAGQNLSFACMSENVTQSLKATALGLNNTGMMAVAAVIPPCVTAVIQHFNSGETISPQAFEKGFLVIPLAFFISICIGLFGVKETFCRQRNTIHQIQKG